MQKKLCALAVILILSLSFAEGEAPQLASSLSAAIDEHGAVTASGGQVRSLSMNISIPSSTPYQIVEAGEPIQFDSDGNGYLAIFATNPPNPFTYSKKLTVASVSRATPALPESYSVPSSYQPLVAPSNRTQSGDPYIRALAENLTAGAQSPFEKVARLAIYVNRNMQYDVSMVGQEKDAIWVSQNLVGVCTEYSTLFAALARSIGIPVRYVSGYVYSDKFQEWMGHAWTEAYIGSWVPVDPTWFEVGALDAMHIEESRGAEFSHRDTLSASVSQSGTHLDWDTGEKGGAAAGNIATRNVSYLAPSANYTIEAAAARLPFGGSTIVYLSMMGTDFRVIPVSLAGCVGTKSVELDESERYLVLQPGKISTIAWEVNASSALPRNYVYTCPLTLNSPYLEKRTVSLGIDPSTQSPARFDASLQRLNTPQGGENSVLLTIPRARRGETFAVVLPDGAYSSKTGGTSAEIPFNTSISGRVPVYVAGSLGDFELLAYNSGSSSSRISIDSFSLPKTLVAGKEAIAIANISASEYPADMALGFSFGGQQSQQAGRLSAPTSFEFPFTPVSPGAYPARLDAASSGYTDEQNLVVTVILQPALSVDSVQTSYSNSTLYTYMSFTSIGAPVSPTASIAGSTYAADAPLTLALPLGKHAIHLAWSDGAGNQYSAEDEITVAQPGILGASLPVQGCPLTSALLLTVLVFSARGAGARQAKVEKWK